jgi:beta-phosphoglucomutase
MTTRQFEAIHFDMDGVIADTESLHIAAEKQTCREYDFTIDYDSWEQFKGSTAEAVFQYVTDNHDNPHGCLVEDLVNHKTDVFLDMARTALRSIDGALEFLEWARHHHDTIALVTSSNRRVQECIIGGLGLDGFFDSIVTGDDIVYGKPNPEPYLRSLRKTHTTPGRSLVVEDSKFGITAGLAAGCSVLAIATSHTPGELVIANPTYIARDYAHAREILSET